LSALAEIEERRVEEAGALWGEACGSVEDPAQFAVPEDLPVLQEEEDDAHVIEGSTASERSYRQVAAEAAELVFRMSDGKNQEVLETAKLYRAKYEDRFGLAGSAMKEKYKYC
jgi:hypothetical protein